MEEVLILDVIDAVYTIGGVIIFILLFGFGVICIRIWDFPNVKEALKVVIKALRKDDNSENLNVELAKAEGILLKSNVMAKSPLQLTELGIKKNKESGFEDCINNNKEELLEKLENKLENSKNPYDVQERSFDVIAGFMKENKDGCFDKIKLYSYKTGIRAVEFIGIGGIYLRDIYLKENKIEVPV